MNTIVYMVPIQHVNGVQHCRSRLWQMCAPIPSERKHNGTLLVWRAFGTTKVERLRGLNSVLVSLALKHTNKKNKFELDSNKLQCLSTLLCCLGGGCSRAPRSKQSAQNHFHLSLFFLLLAPFKNAR